MPCAFMKAMSFFTSAITSGPMPSPGRRRSLCVAMVPRRKAETRSERIAKARRKAWQAARAGPTRATVSALAACRRTEHAKVEGRLARERRMNEVSQCRIRHAVALLLVAGDGCRRGARAILSQPRHQADRAVLAGRPARCHRAHHRAASL